MSENQNGNEKQKKKAVIILVIAIGVLVIALISIYLSEQTYRSDEPEHIVRCAVNLRGFSACISIYADNDKDNKYPTANKWCVLLIEHADEGEKSFRCPTGKKTGDINRSYYEMNPKCEPNSPPDTVLLFETKGGWNPFGGAELLTAENHQGKGCNILFNDGYVKFVEKERFSELKWE